MDFRLMGSKKTVRCVLLTAALTVVATAAAAQSPTDGRGRVFGFVGGSFGEGGAGPVTGGGVGLRVTRHLGLDLEVRHTIGLDLSNDDFVVQDPWSLALFAPFSLTRDAGLTTFMTRMTVEFPAAGGRLFPYVTGGGGVGSLSERIGFGCSAICPALSSQFIAIGPPALDPPLSRDGTARDGPRADSRRGARRAPLARTRHRRRSQLDAAASQPAGARCCADRSSSELSVLVQFQMGLAPQTPRSARPRDNHVKNALGRTPSPFEPATESIGLPLSARGRRLEGWRARANEFLGQLPQALRRVGVGAGCRRLVGGRVST